MVQISHLKPKKTIKKHKVNKMPYLGKSSEHVTLADAEVVNKELKGTTSIQKWRKYVLNIALSIRAEVAVLIRSIHNMNSSKVL